MNLEKTIKNLEARHFKVSHFATGAEADRKSTRLNSSHS